MKRFWSLSPWIARLVVLGAAGLFTMISLKFILDPQHAAASAGIVIEPGIGTTNTRAGFGGFPLGFAAILVFCVLSSRRLLAAVASIASVSATILLVRLFGAVQDASFEQSAHLLIPEAAILLISLIATAIEARRRYHIALA
jgi:hypothetical protein